MLKLLGGDIKKDGLLIKYLQIEKLPLPELYKESDWMSEYNGKVCCNCRHNKRKPIKGHIECHCDIDNRYLGYVEVMTGWCRHWSREICEGK